MTAVARLNQLDSRAWRTATWLAPVLTQLLLALVIVTSWLVGKWFPGTRAVVLFLVGAAVTSVLCAGAAAALFRSTSSRAQGIALSLGGCFAVVLVGGLVYGFWSLAW
jgi:hypothetical protein